MSKPVAYEPLEGYQFQILVRTPYYGGGREWESLDYATDRKDKKYLLGEYELVYKGQPHQFKTIMLPRKYWPVSATVAGNIANAFGRIRKEKRGDGETT